MMGKQKFTPEEVIAAIREAQGMQYLAAKILGCDPKTVYNYMKRYVSVRQAKDDERGLFLDLAETELRSAVVAGEAWAIRFALGLLAKDRGYVEKKELEVKSETCVTINWE